MKRFGISFARIAGFLFAAFIAASLPYTMISAMNWKTSFIICSILLCASLVLVWLLRTRTKLPVISASWSLWRKIGIILMVTLGVIFIMGTLRGVMSPAAENRPYRFCAFFVLVFVQTAIYFNWTLVRLWSWLISEDCKKEIKKRYMGPCPDCGGLDFKSRGRIMEFENRFFIFYQCSNYPKCKHSVRVRKKVFSESKSST